MATATLNFAWAGYRLVAESPNGLVELLPQESEPPYESWDLRVAGKSILRWILIEGTEEEAKLQAIQYYEEAFFEDEESLDE